MSQAVVLFQFLLKFGPKLREYWPLIIAAYEAIKAFYEAIQKDLPPAEQDTGILELVSDEFTPEEEELEAQVVAAFSAGGAPAMFDGSRLRGIAKWLKAHPELAGTLFGLFGKFGG